MSFSRAIISSFLILFSLTYANSSSARNVCDYPDRFYCTDADFRSWVTSAGSHVAVIKFMG